jgi:hypothetical protein
MKGKGEKKQQEKCQSQRVFVNFEAQSSLTNRSGIVRIQVLISSRFGINCFFSLKLLRLRGTLLIQEGGQQNVHPHLKKLALPVFKDCFDKVTASEILNNTNLGLLAIF